MISIIKMIIRLFYRPNLIQFWRVPAYKTYRAHLLGLTLAFVFLVWMQCDMLLIHDIPDSGILTSSELIQAQYNFLYGILIIFWFALVTYYFGIWAVLTVILFFVAVIFMPEREYRVLEIFRVSTFWYLGGYIGGVVLATLYNDILYLYIKIFRGRENRLLFACYRDRIINIIKSPDINEEEAFAATRLSTDKRIYDLHVPLPRHTYTIALVANPVFQIAIPNQAIRLHRDPIIRDPELFLRCVAQALQVFAANEVLGRPEIWSRVRVVTIFDDQSRNRQFPLVEAYIPQIVPGQNLNSNQDPQDFDFDGVVVPVANLDQKLQQWINAINQVQSPRHIINFTDIDVFYFLTSYPDFLRSSAQFTIDNIARSASFTHATDSQTPVTHKAASSHVFSPGKVALNVLGARHKTYIHEFAHAMSSAYTGAIFDEYFDLGIITNAISPALFSINRMQRGSVGSALPQDFCVYQGHQYYTDREHPSLEENWKGYYPEKAAQNLCCTMDRTYGPYHMDRLICDYMYDRLLGKIL